MAELPDVQPWAKRTTFGQVSTLSVNRNTRSAQLYAFLWAGPNRKSLEGADYIVTMGE